MVFQTEATFQQFIHSKFRENTVRILHIPCLEEPCGKVFLVVNKYGKVGLYEPEKMTMLHTYQLDLSIPMNADMSKRLELIARKAPPPPKCQRTHLVVDAVYAPDVHSVVFATSKNVLQWYDLGEIESLSFGLEVFPRKKFLKLKVGQSPVTLRNKGHVETHRLFGLPSSAPFYCLEYYQCSSYKRSNPEHSTYPDNSHENANDSNFNSNSYNKPYYKGEHANISISTSTISSPADQSKVKSYSKLIIGDQEGMITIISIENPRKPFGKRKQRGTLHKIKCSDLERAGLITRYKAHNEIIRQIRFIPQRQLIISCSRDKKFSLFIKDFSETTEPYIISLPKGVNTFAQNHNLKIIATGSEDGIVRLFNQFVMKMPQMELLGHKSPIVALEFLQVPFSDHPILVSYSVDVELRAWDPVDYICLQTMYISFPDRSSIMSSKVPEFGKQPLIIHQPHYNTPPASSSSAAGFETKENAQSSRQKLSGRGTARKSKPLGQATSAPSSLIRRGKDGFILVLYCNSYAKLDIEKDETHWPFDFDDFIAEFEEVSTVYEKKLHDRHRAYAESKYSSKDPNALKLNPDEIAGIEAKLDSYVQEILKIKRNADKQLRSAIYDPNKHSLAGEGTCKFLELKDRSGQAELFKKAGISTAFKSIPLYDLEPIEFTTAKERKRLPVTPLMEDSGLKEVTSVNDLLTPIAKKCFVGQRIQDTEFEAAITARTADLESELSLDLKEQLKKERAGETMPHDFELKVDDEDDNEKHQINEDDSTSIATQESYKQFYGRK